MGGRILVVEDNEQSLQLTSFLLEALGHLAVEARSGGEAVKRARRQPVDLVLVDIRMLDDSRFDTVAELRTLPELESTPIVALTTQGTSGDWVGSGNRVDGFVTKPMTPESFAAEVDEFLPEDRRSALRSHPRRGASVA